MQTHDVIADLPPATPTAASVRAERTLLVIPWSPEFAGGVSTVVRHLRGQWLSSGHLVELAVESWPDKSPSRRGDELHYRFGPMGFTVGWRLPYALLCTLPSMARTARLLKRQNIQAVNFHYPSLSALSVALLKRLGLFNGRLVLSFHGTDVRQPMNAFDRWAWQTIFSACTAITVCSHSLGRRLRDVMDAPDGKLHVAYNGVDARTFSVDGGETHPQSVRIPFARYVVSIGSFIPRKGHRILLDAFLSLREPGLGLVIAGMDGPERESLMDLADKAGATDRVLFLCDLKPNQVADVLRRSTLAVQPALDEPFGLAVIEAAACGVPVAVSAVGGHLEIVDDERTGWVFSPASSAACTAAMQSVLADGGEARSRADTLRREVLDRFSWRRCADTYQMLLHQVGTVQPPPTNQPLPP